MSTRGFLTEILLHIYRVRTIAPEENCLLDNPPCMTDLGLLPPGQLLPRKIIPLTSVPQGKLPPGRLLSENYPKNNCPLEIAPR